MTPTIRLHDPPGWPVALRASAQCLIICMKITGRIAEIETIAEGHGLLELAVLRQRYGDGNWKKKKGIAQVGMDGGHVVKAQLHWYEAHGIGRVKLKVKKWL